MSTKTVALLLGLLFTLPAFGQDMGPPPAELKEVDYMVGKWEGDMTMTMGPGQVSKMKGAMVTEKVLGARYIRSMHSMSGEGMPEMFGMFMLTYDGNAKTWMSWWFDSTAAGVLEMTGPMADNVLTMTSKPTKMEGMGEVTMRSIWTRVSDTQLKMKVEMLQGKDWVEFVSGDFKKK